ncbi:hypothetical protein [Flavobacterium sp.]|jgi:hypothetical protein|uniref:hypothetical protein n=1 Tax=Flavobacterium sp. TaxID=239 RepID=UPI0022C3CAA7|nr:hypothetical protein [Flavobacterium sp.]MCZ8298498.1 hypothetical protein [Flavobacterium sp.]
MSLLKDAYTAAANIFSKQFYFFASLASIVGLVSVFISDKNSSIIALIFFCLMLLIFTISLLYTIFKVIGLNNSDFESKSTFVKYETSDCKNITFEIYKLIQSKKPILSDYTFNFKWTGSILPNITSDLQEVTNVMDLQDPTQYDKAILKFKKPVYFNENQVIHFKAALNDTDKQSETYVSNRITQEVDIIHYRIILKYKPSNYDVNAILEKRKINSLDTKFEKVEEIGFDDITKSYEYHLLKPDLGYIYRISWNR